MEDVLCRSFLHILIASCTSAPFASSSSAAKKSALSFFRLFAIHASVTHHTTPPKATMLPFHDVSRRGGHERGRECPPHGGFFFFFFFSSLGISLCTRYPSQNRLHHHHPLFHGTKGTLPPKRKKRWKSFASFVHGGKGRRRWPIDARLPSPLHPHSHHNDADGAHGFSTPTKKTRGSGGGDHHERGE